MVTDAASYPTDVEARITVGGELHVHFRALHKSEEAPIRDLYARLGPEARYQRFLSPMPALSDAVVQRLAAVDHRSSLAIVAEDDEAGRVIGMASFSAADAETAEVAVAVADDWQRRGVGTALVGALLTAADRRGFRRFAADIASGNLAIRKILARFGRVVATRTSSGVSELLFVLLNRLPREATAPDQRAASGT